MSKNKEVARRELVQAHETVEISMSIAWSSSRATIKRVFVINYVTIRTVASRARKTSSKCHHDAANCLLKKL